MAKAKIYYKEGYRYQLHEDTTFETGIKGFTLITDFLSLNRHGTLTCKKGYAWNGVNKPAINTKTNKRGSLVHDAMYQLIEEKLLAHYYRKVADRLFRNVCLEDGMMRFRAWYCYKAVRKAGGKYCRTPKPVLIAP